MAIAELQAIERDATMATYLRQPVEFVRGEGTKLWDDEGNEYLDFMTGLAVVSLGHCHPAVVDPVREQVGRLIHVGNLFYTEPAIRLAEQLVEASLEGRAFLCNSGTEAIECAIKLARKRRRGGDFVVLEGGFHGRSMGALSATPQETRQEPFAPLVPGFKVVGRDDPDALAHAVDENTAAVILEVVQGESGIHPLSHEMLVTARTVCDAHDALLIMDEIQCGMGRTGALWAWQRHGVRPNVMTVAKGLGGGLPIGACITDRENASVLQVGDHGSTFAGGPVIASAARAVLDTIDDEAFLAEVVERGERLAESLRGLGLKVRGEGLMLAFQQREAPDLVRAALFDQRLVLNATDLETVRLLPPLTVSEAEIDDAVARIGVLLA